MSKTYDQLAAAVANARREIERLTARTDPDVPDEETCRYLCQRHHLTITTAEKVMHDMQRLGLTTPEDYV